MHTLFTFVSEARIVSRKCAAYTALKAPIIITLPRDLRPPIMSSRHMHAGVRGQNCLNATRMRFKDLQSLPFPQRATPPNPPVVGLHRQASFAARSSSTHVRLQRASYGRAPLTKETRLQLPPRRGRKRAQVHWTATICVLMKTTAERSTRK